MLFFGETLALNIDFHYNIYIPDPDRNQSGDSDEH